jgi:hypothetical protein
MLEPVLVLFFESLLECADGLCIRDFDLKHAAGLIEDSEEYAIRFEDAISGVCIRIEYRSL